MRADDEVAFDAFVRASAPALLRTATLLAGDEALGRDLLQSALIKTLIRWRTIDTPTSYVRRTMGTIVIDWSRGRRFREVPLSAISMRADATLDASNPERNLANRDQALRLLATLPPAQRAVLVLRYFDDLTEAATAETLGISVGAVKSATSRGLAALRVTVREEVDQ